MADFQYDLTDVTDEGFVVVPPGRYPVVANPDNWVFYVKEETLNPVIRMGAVILDGEFQDESVAYFSTMTKARISKANFLRALRAFGIIKDSDRGEGNKLQTSLDLGEPNEQGHSPVLAIVVNGQKRPVEGKAIAVITHQGNDKTKTSVDRFEPVPEGFTGSAPSPQVAEDDVPF